MLWLFTTFSCCFVQKVSLHDSEDNFPIARDVKKNPSSEEDPFPNPKDDEMTTSLSMWRKFSENLTWNAPKIGISTRQFPISQIEEMEAMKKNIIRNPKR